MIATKGYAAQSPETDLAPWSFERREVGPHDVQFDILFCGVCHSDLHQIKNDWFPGIFPMVPGHEIVSDIEMIDIKDIKSAYERMLKGDVRYRFVIDMATL